MRFLNIGGSEALEMLAVRCNSLFAIRQLLAASYEMTH